MEHHGENPLQNVIAVIPARFASTRLPGKLLLPVGGKPLILHTLQRAVEARTVGRAIVATDDQRICDVIRDAGGEVMMTSSLHASGSDRVAEVAEQLPAGSIIVNVQGDEPLISPETIDRAVEAIVTDEDVDIATTYEPIASGADLSNPNIVKVVTDARGRALYFSRSLVPFPRDPSIKFDGDPGEAVRNQPELLSIFKKHTGLYVYRREFLLEFTKLPQSALEKIEMLEQLRALESGAVIKVVRAAARSIGVDTQEDLDEVRRTYSVGSITIRRAVRADVRQIARIHVESWQRSFVGIAPQNYLNSMSVEKRDRAFSERFTERGYRMLVAANENGQIVGFIDYGRPDLENFGYEARIYSFYLLREFQRQGVGGRLFRRCFEDLVSDGVDSVCLDTLEMSPYRRFYDKAGGRIIARDIHHLGDEEFATVIYGWDNLQNG